MADLSAANQKTKLTPESPAVIVKTKVLRWDGPNATEQRHDEPLRQWCETQIEGKEESDRRRFALQRLQNIMAAWIRAVMINDFRMSAADAERYKGRIFTTGSYRYNVHTSGSDIDAVLIAPRGITREHFFSSLVDRLTEDPNITEMTPVYTAKVPIIAMKVDGIDMDLSFGSILADSVPATIDESVLRGLDDKSVRSANAVRVAHQLLEFAPDKFVFRQALRFVKAWAKVRGIHGSQYGFPTGIGWAILVCHVCQCHPNTSPAGALAAFFTMYRTWFNPEPHKTGRMNTSIFLNEKRITSNEFGNSWNPQENKWDAMAVFPVLTPVAPSTNSCDMVNENTLRIICAEFARGFELIDAAFKQRPIKPEYSLLTVATASSSSSVSTTSSTTTTGASDFFLPAAGGAQDAKIFQSVPFGVWSALLEPYAFFASHKYFLHIEISCASGHVEKYKPYVDSCESRLYRLLSSGKGVDRLPNVRIRPWPKRFEEERQKDYLAKWQERASAVGKNERRQQQQKQQQQLITSAGGTGAGVGAVTTTAGGVLDQGSSILGSAQSASVMGAPAGSDGVSVATTTVATASGGSSAPDVGGGGGELLAPSAWLSTHIFVALDVKETPIPATAAKDTKESKGEGGKEAATPQPQQQSLDLKDAVRVFTEAVTSDPNNFTQGITRAPLVSVDTVATLPRWVYDPTTCKALAAKQLLAERLVALQQQKEQEEKERLERQQQQQQDEMNADDDVDGGSGSVTGAQKRLREEEEEEENGDEECDDNDEPSQRGVAGRNTKPLQQQPQQQHKNVTIRYHSQMTPLSLPGPYDGLSTTTSSSSASSYVRASGAAGGGAAGGQAAAATMDWSLHPFAMTGRSMMATTMMAGMTTPVVVPTTAAATTITANDDAINDILGLDF